jgi:hypothetical protein
MLYELRTYTLKQGTLGEVVKAAAEISTDIRKNDYGKLEGYWFTEIGPLNQVIHMWSYDSYEQRGKLRAELSKNPRWNTEYLPAITPHVVRQEIRLMNAVRGIHLPASGPNFYEMRNYRCAMGARPKWVEHFTAALETREKYSKIVGLWITEAPQVNEVLHMWAYPDLNARTVARGGAGKDPRWQQFLKDTGGLLEEMTSTVMMPAPHSPLK